MIRKFLKLTILVLALMSPTLFATQYRDNHWTLLQETTQKNLLRSLWKLIPVTPATPGQRILITGLNFPFHPFSHPEALVEFYGDPNLRFDVVDYVPNSHPPLAEQNKDSIVRRVTPAEIDWRAYSYVWAYYSDGKLAREISNPAQYVTQRTTALDFSAADIVTHPDMYKIFGSPDHGYIDARPLNSSFYLDCGTALLSYYFFSGAEKCLIKMTEIDTSPYGYFYLGRSKEEQKDIDSAAAYFQKAVELDATPPFNPTFKSALERVQKLKQGL